MTKLALLGKNSNIVYSFAFSRDKALLASGDYSGTIRLWDCHTGMLVDSLIGYDLECDRRPKMIGALAFSPDSSKLAVGLADYHGEYHLRLWDVETRTEYARVACDEISDLDFGADGTWIACGSADLWLRDGLTGSTLAVLQGHRDFVICVAVSPDGTLAASGTAYDEGIVRIWDLSSRSLHAIAGQNNGNVEHVWFGPDGRQLYWFGWDGLHLWDIKSAKELARWPNIRGGDRKTILDPSCRVAAIVNHNHDLGRSDTIQLIDLETEQVVNELLAGVNAAIMTIRFSFDGRLLAIGDENDKVYLWRFAESG